MYCTVCEFSLALFAAYFFLFFSFDVCCSRSDVDYEVERVVDLIGR